MESRPFTILDYGMICDWWEAHGTAPVPLELLPKTGIITGEILAGWIYFDTSTPVCFASHLVSRPGLRLEQTLQACTSIFLEAEEQALSMGYSVMLMYAPKAIARYAVQNLGFVADRRELMNLAANLKREEICQ